MKYRRKIQSPLIYLQAAGSTGADGTARGIHLRWGLLGDLGANHLPKGNLAGAFGPYSSSLPYNRMGDFVLLFRAAYTRYAITVDLSTETPDRIVEFGRRSSLGLRAPHHARWRARCPHRLRRRRALRPAARTGRSQRRSVSAAAALYRRRRGEPGGRSLLCLRSHARRHVGAWWPRALRGPLLLP